MVWGLLSSISFARKNNWQSSWMEKSMRVHWQPGSMMKEVIFWLLKESGSFVLRIESYLKIPNGSWRG